MIEIKLAAFITIISGLLLCFFGYFIFKISIKILSFLFVLFVFIFFAGIIKNGIISIILICVGIFMGYIVVRKVDSYELVKFASALIMAFIFIVVGWIVLLILKVEFTFLISSLIILGIIGLIFGDMLFNKYFLIITTSLTGAFIFVYGLNSLKMFLHLKKSAKVIQNKHDFFWHLFVQNFINTIFNNFHLYIILLIIIFICGVVFQVFLVRKFERQKSESEIAENML